MLARLIRGRLAASKKSILLLGARQVGKSTLARSLGPDVVVNLADEALFLGHGKDPGRLGRELRARREPALVLIDEVQRLPGLLNTVQALIDEGLRHRFVLTGSSARKLKRGGANLLPGRIVLEYLDPLSFWELGDAFELDRALRVGTLPGIHLDRETGDEVLDTYATVYLREEIQAEALVRDVGSYARFLDAAAVISGDWINLVKFARDSEIPKETLRRFFEILEDTLIAFRLPPFDPGRSKRRVRQRERVFFFDLGVRNAILGEHRHPASQTDKGRLFEHWLILQHWFFIRANRLPWKLQSYRTDGGAEVDLVVDLGRSLLAIECKLGKHVTRSQLGGLRSLAEIARKPVRPFVVYGGETVQDLGDGILAVPWAEFLRKTLPELAAESGGPDQ